jgi:protein arginine kinase
VDGSPLFERASRIPRDRLDGTEIRNLVELRLANPSWWDMGSDRWAVVSQDAIRSLLINEEDHLRLQAILPGLQVEFSLRAAEDAERQLAQRLELAWRDGIGFLTSSLSNAGTGLRLGVMLHLPALSATNDLENVLSAASELGCAVRGAYGEGSSATGAFYQVSNTRACFVETYRIVDRVRASALYLIEAERKARRAQFADGPGKRSLREATADVLRLLFEEDAAQPRLLGLVSILRLAAAEGVLPVDLAECAAWITIAGASPAPTEDHASETSFQAIQRTAAIRQRVRRALGNSGTFFTGINE